MKTIGLGKMLLPTALMSINPFPLAQKKVGAGKSSHFVDFPPPFPLCLGATVHAGEVRMYIDQEVCKKCVDCIPVCPVGAIRIAGKKVVIEYETCVECGVCRRLNICPQGAIKQVDPLPYPRILRAAFSDPMHRHESTDVLGRGTEEMKTNDVKNDFTPEVIGFSVELGRPGVALIYATWKRSPRRLWPWAAILLPITP
jgi:ferredoxin